MISGHIRSRENGPREHKNNIMKLFVDVDDTLILWQEISLDDEKDGTYYLDPYKINYTLIVYIRNFSLVYPNNSIIIWSGGGKNYAQYWIDKLELSTICIAMLKDKISFDLIKEGDIVVDDEFLNGKRTHKPNELP